MRKQKFERLMTEKKGRARKEIKDERIRVRKFEKGKLNRGIDKQK